MEIIYPEVWKKCNKYFRLILFSRNTKRGFQTCDKIDYINGYRQAIKDVKYLNK